MSTSSRKVNLVKNSRGDLRFERCDPSGTKVTIKNNGTKSISMRGWRLIKNINGVDKCKFNFADDYTIGAQREVTICGKVMADELEYGELLGDFNTWGTHGKFILFDDKNVEKASMDVQVL